MAYNYDYFNISFLLCFLFMFMVIFVTNTEGQQLVPAVFMFGDSLVDVGNNNHLELSLAKANFPHNGIDYPGGKATGRFCNGKNSADLLAEKIGLPMSPPPYLTVRSIFNRILRKLENSNMTEVIKEGGGVSFASGGAGILNETNILFYPDGWELAKKSRIIVFPYNLFHMRFERRSSLVEMLNKNWKTQTIENLVFSMHWLLAFTDNDIQKQSISMSQQIDYFSRVKGELVQHLGAIDSQTYLSKSIMGISIGSNDLLGYFKPDSPLRKKYSTPQQYIDFLVLTLKGQLKRIYDLGGRKFSVSGTGLVGCCPAQRNQNKTGNGECNEEANHGSFMLNEGVKAMLDELKSEFMDINYSLFSTYNIMFDVIQNPSQYGFSEIRSACCGLGKLKADVPCLPIATYCKNREDHIFWDLYHPTEAAVKVLIDTHFNGSPKYTYPMNLAQLVAI